MKQALFNLLEQARQDNRFVSVYFKHGKPGSFALGYVDALSPRDFRLRNVHPNGTFDGLAVHALDDVARAEVEGDYERAMRIVEKNHERLTVPDSLDPAPPSADIKRHTLEQAMARNAVVEIADKDNDSSWWGYVKELTTTHVILDRIENTGSPDGRAVAALDNILTVQCLTPECRKAQLLHQARQAGEL